MVDDNYYRMDTDAALNQELQHRVAADNEVGSFFDCPICLGKPSEPILTCCGHIFCRACFYQVPHSTSSSRSCPVCRGDIPDSAGNGVDEQRMCKTKFASPNMIPLRPKALTLSDIVELLVELRLNVAKMARGTAKDLSYIKSQERQIEDSPQRIFIVRCLRVLSHDAHHIASISTKLSIIEKMLVEQLNTMTNNGVIPLNQQLLRVAGSAKRGQGCSSIKGGDTDSSKVKKSGDSESGSFFYCNICLDQPTEPILTCCGHLFCWACFYQVPHIDSTNSSRRCPACRGDVPDSAVIPIYGNEKGEQRVCKKTKSAGLKIPLRPKARGVESRSLTLFPILEKLRQLRINIGRCFDVTEADVIYIMSKERQTAEASGSPQGKLIRRCLKLVANIAFALTSLPSVLSDFEKRLVEQLDMMLNNGVP